MEKKRENTQIALQYIKIGEIEKARKSLKEILLETPKNERAWLLLLKTYNNQEVKEKIAKIGLQHTPNSKELKQYLQRNNDSIVRPTIKQQNNISEQNKLNKRASDKSLNIEIVFGFIIVALALALGFLVFYPKHTIAQSTPAITPLSEMPPTWTPEQVTSTPSTRAIADNFLGSKCWRVEEFENEIKDLTGYDAHFSLSEGIWDREWMLQENLISGYHGILISLNSKNCIFWTKQISVLSIKESEISLSGEDFGTLVGIIINTFGIDEDVAVWYLTITDKFDKCFDGSMNYQYIDSFDQTWAFHCEYDPNEYLLTLVLEAKH